MNPGVIDAEIATRIEERLLNTGEWRTCTLLRVQGHSRNTVLYWFNCDGTILIGKRYVHRSSRDVIAEFEALHRYGPGFDTIVSMARAFAVYDDLGVLIMYAAKGRQLRQVIEWHIRRNKPIEGLARPIELAARGLAMFHRMTNADRPALYIDYSPRNVLVSEDTGRIALIDPPGRLRYGQPHLDIGTFCFDLSRIAFALFRGRLGAAMKLTRLSEWFIRAYFVEMSADITEDDISLVEYGERRRAARVMRWYANFRRYPSWQKELLRCAFMVPQVWSYERYGLNRKYRSMRLVRTLASETAG